MKIGLDKLAQVAILAFALRTFSDNRADVDLWGNVGFVKALPWSSNFHRTNTFSFTAPDHPWINHEWLAQYIFNRTWTHFGNTGLLALKLALGFAMLAIWNFSIKQRRVALPIGFLTLCLVISSVGYGFSTRPHLWSYLLLSIFLCLLERWQSLPAAAFAVFPFLSWIWANLHGAFFVGLLVLCVFVAARLFASPRDGIPRSEEGQRFAALCAATLASACVSLATPYGLNLWSFIAASFGKPRPFLSEWAPFSISQHLGEHTDFIALALLSAAALLARPAEVPAASRAVALLALASAFVLRRQIPVFAIAAVYSTPPALHLLAGRPLLTLANKTPKWLTASFLAAFTALSAVYTIKDKHHPLEIEIPEDKFPTDIVSFMSDARLTGNALVFFDWAEQVIWHCYPYCRVFMDGRFSDAYDDETIRDYFLFLSGGPNWNQMLAKRQVDIALLHNDLPVAAAMAQDPAWQIAASNSFATLLVRTSSPAAAHLLPANQMNAPTSDFRKGRLFP